MTNTEVVALIVVGAFVGIPIVSGYLSATATEASRENQITALKKEFERLNSGGEIATVSCAANLREGEFALLAEEASLSQLRSVSTTNAVGTRVRLGSIPIYLGQARRHSDKELMGLGDGTLILTNQRLIFVGALDSFSEDLKKIVAVTGGIDFISVSPARGSPRLFSEIRGLYWQAFFQLVTKHPLLAPRLPAGLHLATDVIAERD